MLPAIASSLAFARAKKEVEDVTGEIMRVLEEEEDSPLFVLRVCETMRVLSAAVHASRSSCLWESLVSRFCVPLGQKRALSD